MECSTKAHVLKASFAAWCYLEMVETLRGRGLVGDFTSLGECP
jgi:hypothetical protein